MGNFTGKRTKKLVNTRFLISEHYEKSLTKVWELFSGKVRLFDGVRINDNHCPYALQDAVIVIEEDLILSPDFLYTLALLSETFRKDETIAAIQMWNPNCKTEDISDGYCANTFSLSVLSLWRDQWLARIDLSCRSLPGFRLPLATHILWSADQKFLPGLLFQTVRNIIFPLGRGWISVFRWSSQSVE